VSAAAVFSLILPAFAAGPAGAADIYALPEFREALRQYGAGRKAEAAQALRRTLEKSPGHPGAYYLGGVIRYENGEFDKAEYNFRRAFAYPEKGFNARLDTIHAAILQVKLPHLDGWNQKRAQNAQRYRHKLAKIPGVGLQGVLSDCTHVYHLFMIQVARRDALRQFLQDHGVQTGIHYPTPIHLQAAYADHGWRKGDFPVAEEATSRIVSLPMFPELTAEQIDYVCERIGEFVKA